MKTSNVLMPQSTIYNLRSAIRRIAIFRALYLGDLLCATPALRRLRERFPAAEITLIGLPWAADLATRLPYIDSLAVFPGYPRIAEAAYDAARTDAFFEQARATGYDLAIQMHGDGNISNGFVADLGARISLGYRRGDDQRLSISLPYCEGDHEVLRWLWLLDALPRLEMRDWRLEVPERQSHTSHLQSPTALDFPIAPEEDERAERLLRAASSSLTIGLHAGAKDPARRWPPKRFAALADTLAQRYGATIVLTGSSAERGLTSAVRRAMRYPALDLAGQTDLGTFAALISRLDLLVTNDTGASHLAAASVTPSVVLFGPSRPEQWAPLNRWRHRAVDALAIGGPAADPATALRRLPVAPVLDACIEMLTSNPLSVVRSPWTVAQRTTDYGLRTDR